MRMIERRLKAKKLLVCRIGQNEYNLIQLVNQQRKYGNAYVQLTSQVKESKVDITLTTQYETFTMKNRESITNELHCVAKVIRPSKQV